MLGIIRKDIGRLIAAYEAEKKARQNLENELGQCRAENEIYRKRIEELVKQSDNLKLQTAFLAISDGDRKDAKKRIEGIIREIDRCIALVKKWKGK